MHNGKREQKLRVNAGKTISKKALSKQNSLAASRVGSRVASKANSKAASEADPHSPDRSSFGDDDDASGGAHSPEFWEQLMRKNEIEGEDLSSKRFESLVNMILAKDWRRRDTAQKQPSLLSYISILSGNFMADEMQRYAENIMPVLVNVVNVVDDTTEVSLALKAIEVTIINHADHGLYGLAAHAIKRAITDSSDFKIKAQAIHTLSIILFYGELSENALLNEMDFFLEIVSSDGSHIDALDESGPVAAALKAWGLLTTLIEGETVIDTDTAFEVFVDQLDSTSTAVQIAAGENIALLYEKAYEQIPEEDYRELDKKDLTIIAVKEGPILVYYKRWYDLYPRMDILESKLTGLHKNSTKRMGKGERKILTSSFKNVLHSVQHPTQGPHYSSNLDDETRTEIGNKFKIKSANSGMTATIDKWWKLHRHHALKEVLGAGFTIHYEENPAIFEALPIVFVSRGNAEEFWKGRRHRDRDHALGDHLDI